MLRTVIIDDEDSSRNTLFELLKNVSPEVWVMASAKTVREGVDIVNLNKPDLVFFDLHYPDGSGIDILKSINNLLAKKIVVTSPSILAEKMQMVPEVSVLHKPVNKARLREAIQDVFREKKDKGPIPDIRFLPDSHIPNSRKDDLVRLPGQHGFESFHLDEIIRCESLSNYTKLIKTNGTTVTISKTLKYMESQLGEFPFVRIHRSHLINFNYVVKYIKGRKAKVILTDASPLDIARNKKDYFLQLLADHTLN